MGGQGGPSTAYTSSHCRKTYTPNKILMVQNINLDRPKGQRQSEKHNKQQTQNTNTQQTQNQNAKTTRTQETKRQKNTTNNKPNT
jgi:hypothetical protein